MARPTPREREEREQRRRQHQARRDEVHAREERSREQVQEILVKAQAVASARPKDTLPEVTDLIEELEQARGDRRGREATRRAILYTFNLIGQDGKDVPVCPFLDRKDALARLLHSVPGSNRPVIGQQERVLGKPIPWAGELSACLPVAKSRPGIISKVVSFSSCLCISRRRPAARHHQQLAGRYV
jgi:hypothetical protein